MNAGLELVRSGQLLYTNEVGSDACGIGGVAAKDGKPSAEVLQRAMLALRAMEHRGGVCGTAGDGAGITLQIPQQFFRDEAKRLGFEGSRFVGPDHKLAVGVFFIHDREPARIEQAREIAHKVLKNGPVKYLGTRIVPTNDDVLPRMARDTRPGSIEQWLLLVEGDSEVAERWLYRQRVALREEYKKANLDVYIPSLSTKLLSYKGLLTSNQLCDYYPDFVAPGFESGIAIFHRRYSTNTFPNWKLAQPFRFTCHNGEINTVRTNRNAVQAYSRGLKPPLPGGDICTSKMSDSASLDEWLEHLLLEKNWSLIRALRLSIPPVWDTEADVWGPDAFQLFTYSRRTLGSLAAWDGPAGIIGTDGRYLVGLLDRMGLRPERWCSDKRGWLYIGSESGVFGLDPTTIVASGQLQPGEMIALDTQTGTLLNSQQIMNRVVEESQAELGDFHELNQRQVIINEGFDFSRQVEDVIGGMLKEQNWTLENLLQATGWDFQRAVFVKDMAKLKKEPLSNTASRLLLK
jgi:glutamate synthase (ferredoxin)